MAGRYAPSCLGHLDVLSSKFDGVQDQNDPLGLPNVAKVITEAREFEGPPYVWTRRAAGRSPSTLTSKHSQPTPPWPTTEETMSLKDVYLRPSHSSLNHLLVPTKPTATRICNTHGTKTGGKKHRIVLMSHGRSTKNEQNRLIDS